MEFKKELIYFSMHIIFIFNVLIFNYATASPEKRNDSKQIKEEFSEKFGYEIPVDFDDESEVKGEPFDDPDDPWASMRRRDKHPAKGAGDASFKHYLDSQVPKKPPSEPASDIELSPESSSSESDKDKNEKDKDEKDKDDDQKKENPKKRTLGSISEERR